jgi:hypothetical protein
MLGTVAEIKLKVGVAGVRSSCGRVVTGVSKLFSLLKLKRSRFYVLPAVMLNNHVTERRLVYTRWFKYDRD